jgi:imidazolonepropionase-like amidohydrolase
VGSDIPDIHEYCIKEMELLQSVGMDGMAVLEAATRVNAEILRVADRVGTLEVGKDADFIMVEGDPRTIKNVRNLKLVVKSGRIIVSRLPGVTAQTLTLGGERST